MQSEKIRIVIADDHPLLLAGLSNLINEQVDLELLHAATNGKEALEKVMQLKPDVVILDIEMPEMNGIDVADELLEWNKDAKIIILTFLKDQAIFNKAMEMGVLGFLLKENALGELLNAIRGVKDGIPYLSPSLSKYMLDWKNRNSSENPINKLTKQEVMVLKLISQKKTSREIAEMLFVSPKTIENHRSNISKKLNLDGNHNSLRDWVFENQHWIQ
jgi:two-component system response regulator DegU